MARNKIEDLRNHMFAALERLDNDDLTPDELEMELKKAKAVKNISDGIVDIARVEIDFLRISDDILAKPSEFLTNGETREPKKLN